MINTKSLVKKVRKWQKLAAMGGRVMVPNADGLMDLGLCRKSKPDKGHFVVYTTDGRRFVVPLAYLSNSIFIQLLEMSEEEFGLPGDGPITLPCDAIFMDYIIWLVGRCTCKHVEKALLVSIATGRCSTSSVFHQTERSQQILLHGF